MSTIEKSLTVKKPVRTVYNQWTQFESFPKFMEGVEVITQIGDRRQRWQTNIGGKKDQFDVEITEQIPDKRIAWHSISGLRHGGVVTFPSLTPNETRVMLQIEYQPEGAMEYVGDMFGVVSRRGGKRPRIPALCDESSDECGNNGMRLNDRVEPGNRSCVWLRSYDRSRARGLARANSSLCTKGRFRAVQTLGIVAGGPCSSR